MTVGIDQVMAMSLVAWFLTHSSQLANSAPYRQRCRISVAYRYLPKNAVTVKRLGVLCS